MSDPYADLVRLMSALAHEIKNPLSTIRLNMELLAEDFRDAESPRDRRAAHKIGMVQEECARLQSLLDEFLRFARDRQLRLEPADLNEQVRWALDFFRPQAERAGIELLPHLQADLPLVLLDREAFHGALLNLVINAQQAMPSGGKLWVTTESVPAGVALHLIDTGPGMDQATQARIFDAFYSTKPGGTGLGLPTTRKIIEAHGGTLTVQSEPGRGTRFTITLPRAKKD